MNSNNQARLPEFVGKKIVEALKQDEDDKKILDDTNVPNFAQPQPTIRTEGVFETKTDIRNSTISQISENQFETKKTAYRRSFSVIYYFILLQG